MYSKKDVIVGSLKHLDGLFSWLDRFAHILLLLLHFYSPWQRLRMHTIASLNARGLPTCSGATRVRTLDLSSCSFDVKSIEQLAKVLPKVRACCLLDCVTVPYTTIRSIQIVICVRAVGTATNTAHRTF
eukprot:SAG11_NODE_16671_length_541_cov_0.583710_2_plen_128_part_01